jgi:hypothetical protein
MSWIFGSKSIDENYSADIDILMGLLVRIFM